MLTYNEHIELKEKLVNGEISLELAKEIYRKDYQEGQRSWHSKDWKDRRKNVIKDKCELCSSADTLTLQHLSHPKKYYEYENDVTKKKYAQLFIGSNPIVDESEFKEHIIKNYDYVPVPLCPNCKSRHPNRRIRKIPQYLCTECHHEFVETIYKSIEELNTTFYKNEDALEVRDKCFLSKDKWRNKLNLSNIKYWMQRERAKNKYLETIEKEAFLLYLNDSIKYLSFEGTITACRKCAFNFDINMLELCPECKKYYKSVYYPTCIQCLPEEKRKAALQKIEFGKEMSDMHKRLGID